MGSYQDVSQVPNLVLFKWVHYFNNGILQSCMQSVSCIVFFFVFFAFPPSGVLVDHLWALTVLHVETFTVFI